MANEAVIIELLGNGGDPVRFTCNDGVTISKGAILALDDPRKVSGANIGLLDRYFAGIAAHDKEANDGSTSIACYTNGIFDIYADAAINVGSLVGMSGANKVVPITEGVSGATLGIVVGKALETASAAETINVRIGVF